MSKFCTNCGTALEENTKFCTNCGAVNETTEPVQEAPAEPIPETVVTEAPVQETSTQETPVQAAPAVSPVKKLLANPKKLLIPAIAAVAVILALVLILTLGGGKKDNAYASAFDTYFNYFLGKASESGVKALYPSQYWAFLEESQNKTFDELYMQAQSVMSQRVQSLQNEYGSNVKITYQVSKEWTVSDRNQALIDGALVRQYGFEEGSVTNIYKLELDATIAGSDDEETDDMSVYAVKIDGDWYLMRAYLSGEDTEVYFMAG